MNDKNRKNSSNYQWIAFVNNENVFNTLTKLSQKTSKYNFIIQQSDLENAINYLRIHNSHTQIILDVSQNDDPIKAVTEFAEHCVEGTHLIAIGKNNDIETYRELKKIGVDDYFVLPITENQLLETIETITYERLTALGENIHQCTQIITLSPRGGLYASFISLNLAWLLANEQNANTCLIDWDFYFGLIPLMLNLEPNQGLTEALTDSKRLDERFLKSLTSHKSANLAVLASEQPLDQPIEYSKYDIEKLWDTLISTYDTVVLNLPYDTTFLETTILSQAKYILMIIDASLASARDTANIINVSETITSLDNVKFILMKNNSETVNTIFNEHMKKTIHRGIDYTINYDQEALLNSLNMGQPLAELKPRHKTIAMLRKLAHDIYTVESNIQQPSLIEKATNQITSLVNKLSKKGD